ncbi:MAG: WecB/TagA/CpsF family glycosyltransferase [Candidatus Omnitrophica bacterium]|nr:WecB/TagA/CpsF family glycosyltransferase [Candidatus Omnitrophota bacterium]
MTEVVDILGVNISAVNLELAGQEIDRWIQNRQKVYVCVAPVSTIMDCQDDPEYRKIVNNAGMVTPDGMPVVWLGKLSGNKTIQRTYGPDLMRQTCDVGQKRGYRHYFYGGTSDTLQILEQRLKEQFPDINIVGKYSPPFRKIQEIEKDTVLEEINSFAPDILWVGLGSPKQDYWMSQHRDKLNVPVIVGVGAAFDFLAGVKPQAPGWMQKSGLEWLFRLCCEPGRLWKRYLIGNARFVYLVIKEKLGLRRQR